VQAGRPFYVAGFAAAKLQHDGGIFADQKTMKAFDIFDLSGIACRGRGDFQEFPQHNCCINVAA
jgi:hypothetical protein